MSNIIENYCTTREELQRLYDTSALTLRVSENNTDAIPKFIEWIEQYTPVNKVVYITKDNVMNDFIGDDIYNDNGMFISVLLNDMEDYKAITRTRFEINARWFDDIVNNNRQRE